MLVPDRTTSKFRDFYCRRETAIGDENFRASGVGVEVVERVAFDNRPRSSSALGQEPTSAKHTAFFIFGEGHSSKDSTSVRVPLRDRSGVPSSAAVNVPPVEHVP